jgi:hypothetical protein
MQPKNSENIGLLETRELENLVDMDPDPLTDSNTNKRKANENEDSEEEFTIVNHKKQRSSEPNQIINQPKDSSKRARFSVVVKSDRPLNISKLVQVIGKGLSKGSYISKYDIAKSNRVAFLKIEDLHMNSSVNRLTQTREIDRISNEMNNYTLSIMHYDSTASQDRKQSQPNHAIAKNVPIDWPDDEILTQLKGIEEFQNEENVSQIESCKRLISRARDVKTLMVRIVCKNPETAKRLIKDGTIIDGLKIFCVEPIQQYVPLQCYNCNEYGDHTSHTCKNEMACAKCGEKHKTKTCKKKEEEHRCTLCGDAHAAWSLNCKKKQEAIQKMKTKEAEIKRNSPNSQPANVKQIKDLNRAVKSVVFTAQAKTQETVKQTIDLARDYFPDLWFVLMFLGSFAGWEFGEFLLTSASLFLIF